jgi:DNA repair ATPase RecN
MLYSILRQAEELSGGLRPLGAQAADASRQIVTSIDMLDREIADLTRNLEPGEEERLTEKIEALSKHSEDADAAAPMCALLQQQLDLIRDISARIEMAGEKRSRRIEMLRTLALHVASLSSRQAPSTSELNEISDTVRALCEEIARRASRSSLPILPSEENSAATVERPT